MHEFLKRYLASGRTRFINSTTLSVYRHSPDFLRRWGAYSLWAVRRSRNKLPARRFLVFAQGRTGSTLLIDLLNSHPEVFAFGEIFEIVRNVRYPRKYAEGICSLSKRATSGFKVMIYQWEGRHHKDPAVVLKEFHDHGWKIIYLQRANLLEHAVSDIRAEKTRHFHDVGGKSSRRSSKISVSFDELMEVIKYREACIAREERAISDVPHLTIVYEDDLSSAERQQRALDRIFDYLGIATCDVTTDFRKVTSRSIASVIENYDELREQLARSPYARFLPTDEAPTGT